jgi:hypothetical protein
MNCGRATQEDKEERHVRKAAGVTGECRDSVS